MNSKEFFSSDLVRLPAIRQEKEDFEHFLSQRLNQYTKKVHELSGTDKITKELKANVNTIESLCSNILQAVEFYFKGFPHKAYEYVRLAADTLPLHELAKLRDETEHLKFLYRIRVGSLTDFTGSDLFHIPFEKRHLVKSQRYSISGLPSLYLGDSVWLCWEELGRPPFESLQISRFAQSPHSSLRILNFALRPGFISDLVDTALHSEGGFPEAIVAYGTCWPLIAASSAKVLHSLSPFIPEYIIPQLLLQWIRNESDFDGVCYFSTRTAQYLSPATPATNYVFPVKTKSAVGLCQELTRRFELTTPMAWPILQNSDMLERDRPSGPPNWSLVINKNVRIAYGKTAFYSCERKLIPLQAASVDAL